MEDFIVWVVWVLAALALLSSGIAVVLFQNPFYSALALIGNLASLAVLYLLLAAEFVAAAQVLVYAGAVVVMFLFVIAYLGGRADAPWAGKPSPQSLAAIVAAAAIAVEIVVVIALKAGDELSTPGAGRGQLRLAGGDRPALPRRPPAGVRGDVDRPPRRRGGRSHPGQRRAQGRAAPSARPRRRCLSDPLRDPLRDRRLRRAHPPQPADRPPRARDHAERGQPRPDRLRAPDRDRQRPDLRADRDGRRRGRSRRRASASSSRSRGGTSISTSTSSRRCADDRRRLDRALRPGGRGRRDRPRGDGHHALGRRLPRRRVGARLLRLLRGRLRRPARREPGGADALLDALDLALGRRPQDRRGDPGRPALGLHDAGRQRRRLPHPRLRRRLHER